MRVISGTAGGMPIRVPGHVARPTTDRVREALFSSLGDLVKEARVLDLFAGSGALGLECLSRGAASAAFVDADRRACDTIRTNLTRTRLSGGTVHRATLPSHLDRLPAGSRFELIFADPPYARDDSTSTLLPALLTHEGLPALLAENGLFILESCRRMPLPEAPRWKLLREKSYGETRLSYLSPS